MLLSVLIALMSHAVGHRAACTHSMAHREIGEPVCHRPMNLCAACRFDGAHLDRESRRCSANSQAMHETSARRGLIATIKVQN